MMNYTDLFDYFKSERAELLDAFRKLSYEEFARNRELSFYSIKDVFVHTINVEDRWLHYRYRGLADPPFEPEKYTSLDSILKYIGETDAKTNSLFKSITEEDLKKPVRKLNDSKFYSLEQVLYHIPIENIHHYGEIFAEFWKSNIDAPYLSYIRYSTERTH